MEVIEKNLQEIFPYENNPRKNDEAVDFVANSIKEFGFKNPIIIDQNGVIVAGHTRYKAAKKLKLKTVPCIMADDLTDEQVKAFRLADNKVAEMAEWDNEKLFQELEGITEIDMSEFAFDGNADNQIDLYKKLYGERLIVFSKEEYKGKFDMMDNGGSDGVIIYARNACFDFAEKLKLDYFLELDDDYSTIAYKIDNGQKLLERKCKQLDTLFECMIGFLEKTGALTVAFAQGGDFIGGRNGKIWKDKMKRKAMNTFFCKTAIRFDFIGRINEDVNMYCFLGMRGEKIFTIARASIVQETTQKNKGGMMETYIDSGTYRKSFYTVMVAPSAVKIGTMGDKALRIHHKITWNNLVPKIISEKWKKGGNNGKLERSRATSKGY